MVGKQLGFSDYELTPAKKLIKWEKFLGEIEVVVVVSSEELIGLIEQHYPIATK